jgi:hypothetical protein
MATQREKLARFGRCSIEIAQFLKNGGSLSAEELLFIENNLLVVQLALAQQQISSKKPSQRHE